MDLFLETQIVEMLTFNQELKFYVFLRDLNAVNVYFCKPLLPGIVF
jgi:hypothetical protein